MPDGKRQANYLDSRLRGNDKGEILRFTQNDENRASRIKNRAISFFPLFFSSVLFLLCSRRNCTFFYPFKISSILNQLYINWLNEEKSSRKILGWFVVHRSLFVVRHIGRATNHGSQATNLVRLFFLCVLCDDLLLDVWRDDFVMAERHCIAAASAGNTF